MATDLEETTTQGVSGHRVLRWHRAGVGTVTFTSHQGQWYTIGGDAESSAGTAVPSPFAPWALRAGIGHEGVDPFEWADRYYAALRANPVAWAAELEERAVWDAALSDGLEDDPWEEPAEHRTDATQAEG